MGVFYSSPKPYVTQELNRRLASSDYAKSRLLNGCYVNVNYRRLEAQFEDETTTDGREAFNYGLGQAGRGATDLLTGGMSDSIFGEAKHDESTETVRKKTGDKVVSNGQLSTLSDTSLGGRYGTSTGRPTPAIQKLDIEMSGDYGSLKKAVLQIKTFDKASFENLEQQLMIPGTEINITYGRVGLSGPANNDEFKGVVYDYSFKLNETLGYDCEIKAVAKGSLVTEMNVNSKLADDGREFTSDFDGLNETQTCVNIFDVFDYDVQDKMDDHEDLDEDEGYIFGGYSGVAHIAGCDCPDAAPEPANDGMVGGNVIFCSLGYIVNKLINNDLLQGNIEGSAVDTTGIRYVCDNQVTIGREYPKLFSANPMKILIRGTDQRGTSHYGGTGGGAIGRFFGASKIWGKNFPNPVVMDGSGKAKLANILIARDTLRSIGGANEMGKEGSKIGVGAFLNNLFKEIYNNTGGAFDLTVSEMTKEQAADYGYGGSVEGKMFIVDRNWVPGAGAKKINLNVNDPRSSGQTVRNVSITGKVPKDMAAAAFVGGTGVASGKKGATVKVIKGEQVEVLPNRAKILNGLIESREVIHDTGYNEESIAAGKTNLQAYVQADTDHMDKARFRKDMYPLELSATMDGIAGIDFGNACTTNIIPSRYMTQRPRIVFTVTKTKHSISPNDWITDIDTICRMEP
tara:strand:+ start:4112 stop:6163 length:2052 start_codon:yes stop_codon:yes gene_type:complete